MTFKPYPKYKASGVEWLGDVPSSWDVKPVKYLLKRDGYKAGPFGSSLITSELLESGQCLVMTPEHVAEKSLDLPQNLFLPVSRHKEMAMFAVCRGDIVLPIVGTLGRAMTIDSDVNAILNQRLARISCDPAKLLPKYFVRLLTEYDLYKKLDELESKGAILNHLTKEILVNRPVPLPSIKEQRDISAFLDRETTKIATLIAKQEAMIDLLKEKRQAVISHAVTKGLDPKVPMKDSGVEWLGDVPEHWRVMKIKHIVCTPITDGPHETPTFVDDGVPFVSAEAISSGIIDFTKIRGHITVDDHARYSQKYKPVRGDIYMIKSGATTGVTAIVDTDVEFNIWSPLAAIRCGEHAVPRFVLNFMRSRTFREAVELNWSFGTQQNIGMGVIENLSLTVPPIDEQLAISSYIESEILKFEVIIAKAQQAIALQKEHRTALISAAVTGKIDVRGQVEELKAA